MPGAVSLPQGIRPSTEDDDPPGRVDEEEEVSKKQDSHGAVEVEKQGSGT